MTKLLILEVHRADSHYLIHCRLHIAGGFFLDRSLHSFHHPPLGLVEEEPVLLSTLPSFFEYSSLSSFVSCCVPLNYVVSPKSKKIKLREVNYIRRQFRRFGTLFVDN